MAPGPVHVKAYLNWKKVNPNTKVRRTDRIDHGIQSFFIGRPPVVDGKLDVKGTINAINARRSDEKSFNGSAFPAKPMLEKVLQPIKEHVDANPNAASPEFKADLNKAMNLLIDHEEEIISTFSANNMPENEVRAKQYHEITHQHIKDYVGIKNLDLLGDKRLHTEEGLTSYLEIAQSGVHDGKKFEDAVQQFMGDEHRDQYGEPAKLFHEMISKSENISENMVDHEKLKVVLDKMKQGKNVFQIYEEHKSQ